MGSAAFKIIFTTSMFVVTTVSGQQMGGQNLTAEQIVKAISYLRQNGSSNCATVPDKVFLDEDPSLSLLNKLDYRADFLRLANCIEPLAQSGDVKIKPSCNASAVGASIKNSAARVCDEGVKVALAKNIPLISVKSAPSVAKQPATSAKQPATSASAAAGSVKTDQLALAERIRSTPVGALPTVSSASGGQFEWQLAAPASPSTPPKADEMKDCKSPTSACGRPALGSLFGEAPCKIFKCVRTDGGSTSPNTGTTDDLVNQILNSANGQ